MKYLKTIYLLFIISLVIWVCFNWIVLYFDNTYTTDTNKIDYSIEEDSIGVKRKIGMSSIDNNITDTSETYFNIEDEISNTKKEEETFSIEDLYGSWLLEEVVLWSNVFAIKNDRPVEYEDRYIGSIFEFQENYFKINDELYKNPEYRINTGKGVWPIPISPYRWYQNYNEFCDKYKFDVNNVALVNMTFSEKHPDLGYCIFIIDKEHIILSGFSLDIIAKKVNPAELNPEDIPKPPGRQNPEYLYGKWKIIDKYVVDAKNELHFNPEVITDVGSEYIGQIFEYQKEYCVFNGVTHKNPVYSYDVILGRTIPEMQLFELNFEPVIRKYHLDGKGIIFEYIQQGLIFENEKVEDMGSYPCYVNKNYIVFMLWSVEDNEDKYDIFLVAERMK